MRQMKDLFGGRFGRLTVCNPQSALRGHLRFWECKCECGSIKWIQADNLMGGRSKSCGCARTAGLPPGRAGFNNLVYEYKHGAKSKGLEFSLTNTELETLFASNCFYCGLPPRQIQKAATGKGSFVYNGIDRKDNAIGYTSENTVPACRTCNFAKNTLSIGEFIEWLDRVQAHRMEPGKILPKNEDVLMAYNGV